MAGVLSFRIARSPPFARPTIKPYARITEHFVLWDAIDTRFRGELMRCAGHVFADWRARRCSPSCAALPRTWCRDRFETAHHRSGGSPRMRPFHRRRWRQQPRPPALRGTFKPSLHRARQNISGLAPIKRLDAFTFLFQENEHGLFQVHAYPFNGTTSTFIVEPTRGLGTRRAG